MTKGVTYLFIGTKHAVVAAVSAMTLREHWDGPISFFCDETALPFAHPIAASCGADIVRFEPIKQRRNSGYLNKTLCPQMTPYTETVQLDLDTVVTGPLDGLWPEQPDEWVLTPFSHWRSSGNMVGGRIRKWKDITPKLVADKQAVDQPALNTGIMAYGPDCWTAKHVWHEVTSRNPAAFIGDETAADLITGQPRWNQYVRLLDDRYNWSPLYSAENADCRIVHIHGRKHTRSDRGLAVWWPHLLRAYRSNFGHLPDWWDKAGDKYFRRYVNENPGCLNNGDR